MDLSIVALHNMRGNWDESEPLALAPESSSPHHLDSGTVEFPSQQHEQQQPSLPPPSSPDKPSLDGSIASTVKQQQEAAAYPLTTPAWANLVVKNEPQEEPQEDKNNDDSGISPGHYTSDTASPHSDRSSSMMVGVNGLSPNSTSSASPEPRLPLHEANRHHDMSYDYSRHMHHHSGSAGIPSPEDMSRDASMSPPAHDNDSNNNEGLDGGPPPEGVEHPIVNSQGKVKTFRCKQCPFVAVTKRDFWSHTASHIKPEKLLTCPKCPFVTEYKHHLEYHLRNHFGSKPYKCEKCSYSCVNKSMLNSHLKSHSNVYQFRCADCSYATKYCHSLKLHLRKYQHKPAMVLNADGTPNPLPIIDVYGTRRGPKAKPKKDPQPAAPAAAAEPMPQQLTSPSPPSLTTTPPMPPTLTPQFQFNAMNGMPAFGGFSGAAALPAAAMPFLAGFPYNQIFGGFPMGNPFSALATATNLVAAASNDEQPANFAQQAMMAGGGIMLTKREPSPIEFEHSSPSPAHDKHRPTEAPVDLTEGKSAPLDLSKPETPKQQPKVPGSTNRRKGRAVKLDRRLIENDSDEEMPQDVAVATPPVKPPVETEVYMQLKHLRTDMQHMYRYICRLEENLCTRQ